MCSEWVESQSMKKKKNPVTKLNFGRQMSAEMSDRWGAKVTERGAGGDRVDHANTGNAGRQGGAATEQST